MRTCVSVAIAVAAWTSLASAQSARIPGDVRLKVREQLVAGAMGAAGTGVGAATTAQAPPAGNANGPVIQAPVGRVKNTTVILGDQISVSGRLW